MSNQGSDAPKGDERMSQPDPRTRADESKDESQTRKVTIEELLGAAGALIIVHRGEEYRLRITSNGKLLLTK